MYADRQSLTDVIAELSADDRQIANKKSMSYLLRVDGSHSDKQQLIEDLEQGI